MTKEDLILKQLDDLSKEIKEVRAEVTAIKVSNAKRQGLSVKEWGIIAGIITTISTTVVTVAQIIFNTQIQ